MPTRKSGHGRDIKVRRERKWKRDKVLMGSRLIWGSIVLKEVKQPRYPGLQRLGHNWMMTRAGKTVGSLTREETKLAWRYLGTMAQPGEKELA